ncbi:MAG: (2Fe-2S)-binding protein [Burkholderiaceae bacterium]
MIVCVCKAVSDRTIEALVGGGARSLADLRGACGIGECCGKCARQARELLSGCLARQTLETARLQPATMRVQEASRAMNVC